MNRIVKNCFTFSNKSLRAFHTSSLNLAPTGTVKFWNSAKGFGFITQESGSDIFVHISGFATRNLKELQQGEKVSFDISEGRRGPIATNVRVLSENINEYEEENLMNDMEEARENREEEFEVEEDRR